jgi:hypothetical protein
MARLRSGEVYAHRGRGDDSETEDGLADADDLGGCRPAGGDALDGDHPDHRDGSGADGRIDGGCGRRDGEGGEVRDDQEPRGRRPVVEAGDLGTDVARISQTAMASAGECPAARRIMAETEQMP